jgi:hypothetical protein
MFEIETLLCSKCKELEGKESNDSEHYHFCKKLNKKLVHGKFHPQLIKIENCGGPYLNIISKLKFMFGKKNV